MATESATSVSITTSAGTVAFDRLGAGRPVLLLHGFAGTRASFGPIADLLAPRYQVLAVDLLGHGESSAQPRDLSVAAQARALSQVAADLDLEDMAIVGHSLGGSVALQLARLVPERTSKLVLIAAGVYYPALPIILRAARRPAAWSILGLGCRRRILRELARLQRGRRAEGQPLAAPPGGWWTLGRAYRAFLGEEAAAEMEEIVERQASHPTLVVWGDRDRLLPIGEARAVFQGKPRVRFVEIEGGGHCVHEEEPALVAELIRGFVD